MRTIKHIAGLVTAFTIAHSITLVLITLEIVQLPDQLVKSAIALSIIYIAPLNIFNPNAEHKPWLVFGFGVIHGFGFAGILSAIQLDSRQLATSLLKFNIESKSGSC